MLTPNERNDEGRTPTQAGDKVRFLISDVFLPSPDAQLFAEAGQEHLEGTIVDFSDSGQKAQVFALVDVIRRQTVVVPVEKLEAIPHPGPDHGT
jgi:hypothetical protein